MANCSGELKKEEFSPRLKTYFIIDTILNKLRTMSGSPSDEVDFSPSPKSPMLYGPCGSEGPTVDMDRDSEDCSGAAPKATPGHRHHLSPHHHHNHHHHHSHRPEGPASKSVPVPPSNPTHTIDAILGIKNRTQGSCEMRRSPPLAASPGGVICTNSMPHHTPEESSQHREESQQHQGRLGEPKRK